MTPAHPLLDTELAAFVQSGGLSINAASSGSDGFPNLARCLGCRLSPDGRRIVLILPATASAAFLADVARNGCIAAVFNVPSSHRTLQFKGDDARVEALMPDDHRRVAAFRASFAAEVGSLGFAVAASTALLAAEDADLVAVSFTPQTGFSQTPGPNAGAPLGAPTP